MLHNSLQCKSGGIRVPSLVPSAPGCLLRVAKSVILGSMCNGLFCLSGGIRVPSRVPSAPGCLLRVAKSVILGSMSNSLFRYPCHLQSHERVRSPEEVRSAEGVRSPERVPRYSVVPYPELLGQYVAVPSWIRTDGGTAAVSSAESVHSTALRSVMPPPPRRWQNDGKAYCFREGMALYCPLVEV